MRPKLSVKSVKSHKIYVIFFLLLCVIPLILSSSYVIAVLIFSLIYTLLAVSYNLVLGYTGLFSLAHASFFAIGAYTSALLSVDLKVQFLPAMLAAGLSSLIVAYVIALVALRTTYHSFGLITLAFTSIISLIYKNWVEITRGPMGIPGVPQPYFELFFFRIDVSTYLQYYYLTLLIIVLSLLFLRKVIRSRIGRALVAIRENPVLAESVGINSKKYMVLAFVLGGFFAGLSGSLYVHFVRFINPDAFAMALTVTALTMTIIGGLGGFNGVVFTAFILFIVPEILRFSPEWRELLFGVFLLACVYLLPEGVEGYFKSILRSSRKKVS